MKALALLIIKIFSLMKYSKFFLSLGSVALSIGAYAMLYGWRFAVGFIALIFFHEMGHYVAARQKKLAVGLPTFIPFVGAWIQMKEMPINAEVEAYVAYAGPFVGTLSAFGMYYLGRYMGNDLCIALAQVGFLINLFNLIPLSPLDGGRITAIISPRIWFLGVPLLIGLWFYHPNPMLFLIAILAIPQLKKAWHFDPALPENKAYYDINAGARFEYTVLYLGLAIILALMVEYK